MVSILAYGPRCPGFDFKIKIRCLLRLINSTAWRFRLESNPPRLGPLATLQNAFRNTNNYTWSFFFKNCPSRGERGTNFGSFGFCLFSLSQLQPAPWTSRLLRPLYLELLWKKHSWTTMYSDQLSIIRSAIKTQNIFIQLRLFNKIFVCRIKTMRLWPH